VGIRNEASLVFDGSFGGIPEGMSVEKIERDEAVVRDWAMLCRKTQGTQPDGQVRRTGDRVRRA